MIARFKAVAKALLPPVVTSALRYIRDSLQSSVSTAVADNHGKSKLEWEMVPDNDLSWRQSEGWSHSSIASRQVEKWEDFQRDLLRPLPFGRSHESLPGAPTDVSAHNTIMTFAYVLGRTLVEREQDRVSVLDWGGGIGHYYQYAVALFPGAPLDYFVKDLLPLCSAGQPLNTGATFISDENIALACSYDFVFASSSLHYARDIYAILDRLLASTDRYFMVTRTPFVDTHNDFVVMQRPHRYGYLTEYACWFLNRKRFIEFVESRGFVLDREVLLAERPFVSNAPEQCRYLGLLFKRLCPESLKNIA